MTSVETIDFDAVFEDITARLKADSKRRLHTPLMRIWDGDWNFRGEVHREITASFQVLNNETGIGQIEMPANYYLSRWMTDVDGRAGHKNIFITVDYNGTRWSGMLDELEQYKDTDGQRNVRATFKHDYEHLKHILVYSNPFFPPEFQFPRLWAWPPALNRAGGQVYQKYHVRAREMGPKTDINAEHNAVGIVHLGASRRPYEPGKLV